MTEDVDWKFVPIQGYCDKCNSRFSRPENLAVHAPCFHYTDKFVDRPNGSGKAFRCQFCLMDYASLQGLVAHILFHFDKQYFCLHCHLWFYTRRTVMQHATHFHSRVVIPVEDPSGMPPPGGSGDQEVDESMMEEPLVEEPLIDLPADQYMPAMDLPVDQYIPAMDLPEYAPLSPSYGFDPPVFFLDPSAIIIPTPEASPEKQPTPSQSRSQPKTAATPKTPKVLKEPKPFPCSHCKKRYKTRNGLLRHEKDQHGVMRPPEPKVPAAAGVADPAAPIDAVPILVPQVVNGVLGGGSGFIQIIPLNSAANETATIEIVASGLNETCEVQPAKPKRRRTTGVIIPRRPKAAAAAAGSPAIKPPPRRRPASTGKRQLKIILPENEVKGETSSKKKRVSTINGWVDGKVHHKENGINNRMLHERAKADQEEAEATGVSRKLYCKNSKWKRIQEEKEEEERRKRDDPKLLMSCFVQLTDIFDCYVYMEEEERNGMMIYR